MYRNVCENRVGGGGGVGVRAPLKGCFGSKLVSLTASNLKNDISTYLYN